MLTRTSVFYEHSALVIG